KPTALRCGPLAGTRPGLEGSFHRSHSHPRLREERMPGARGIHVKADDFAPGVDAPRLRVVGAGKVERVKITIFRAQETVKSGAIPIISDDLTLRIDVPTIR